MAYQNTMFALLLTWQHCNTATILTHGSGRQRVLLQLTLFVVTVKIKNQTCQTQLCYEWQSTHNTVCSIPMESSAGSSYIFVSRIHVQDLDH
jgi:hypothetical protein